jgi:5-methylcytosine-specific restriction endonuclease McrA
MNEISARRSRVKLPSHAYEQLRQWILKRDNWRCQNCGCLENLEVHHKLLRSQGGDDSELNLITLCRPCHSKEHDRSVKH